MGRSFVVDVWCLTGACRSISMFMIVGAQIVVVRPVFPSNHGPTRRQKFLRNLSDEVRGQGAYVLEIIISTFMNHDIDQ